MRTFITVKFISFMACLALSLAGIVANAADLKPEEIVAKHLDSVGTAQTRARAVSRVVQGKAEFKVLVGGAGLLEGKSILVSQGPKLQFMVKFPNNEYHGEQFIYNGSKLQVTASTANRTRSTFGEFVYVQDALIREGLLGGVLSTAWPLGDLDQRKPKLSYEGMKKIDGKQLYDLRYRPKKSTDMDIHLYFEPETFHHVLTVYALLVRAGVMHSTVAENSASIGSLDNPVPASQPISAERATARAQETRYRIEETFSDFKTDKGLTLPSHYTIHFTEEGADGRTTVSEWVIKEEEIVNGDGVDPRNFEVK